MANTALITGAASGLGRQMAIDLARRDFLLGLADQDTHGLQLTADRLVTSQEFFVQQTDVTSAPQCAAFVDRSLEVLGRIDYLILCAGVSMWARFDEVTDLSIFTRLMEVNYLGPVYCIHAALPALTKSRGCIVAVSSLQGEVAIPNHTGYAAAKHALNGFLKGLASELDDQVAILTVMPGWITGTSLRSRAFGTRSEGESPRRHSKESVTVEDCSVRIIKAMLARRRTLYVPSKLGLLPQLQRFAPGLVKTLIGRAVREQRPPARKENRSPSS